MCNSQCAMKVSAFADDSEWASPMIHHRGAILPLRIPHCKKLSLFPVMYCRGTPLERRRCAPERSFADRKEVMTLTDRQILRLLQSRDETALRELTAQYGTQCRKLACRLLGSEEDAAEVWNDALSPPKRPTADSGKKKGGGLWKQGKIWYNIPQQAENGLSACRRRKKDLNELFKRPDFLSVIRCFDT